MRWFCLRVAVQLHTRAAFQLRPLLPFELEFVLSRIFWGRLVLAAAVVGSASGLVCLRFGPACEVRVVSRPGTQKRPDCETACTCSFEGGLGYEVVRAPPASPFGSAAGLLSLT